MGNNAAAPGEQLGVQCLAPGSQLSRGIEGGENLRYSLLTPTIPAGAEIRTHNLRLQVRRSIHKAMTDIWCALHKCTLICTLLCIDIWFVRIGQYLVEILSNAYN